jgi:hypothetical protein
MVTASIINRLSQAIDQIEKRSQPARPFRVVEVRRGWHEDPGVAKDRHLAAHPEDRGADVIIFHFVDDVEGTAEASLLGRRAPKGCDLRRS